MSLLTHLFMYKNDSTTSNPGAVDDGRIPADEANINSGTSRSNIGGTLIAEVEPGAPGDTGAALVLKGTEDVIDFEAQAPFALVYWRDPDDQVYIVKSPTGDVGYVTEAALDLLTLEVTSGLGETIPEPDEPSATLTLGPEPTLPDEDGSELDTSSVPIRSHTDEIAMRPPEGIVVQVTPGEGGLLYLVTGERLTQEKLDDAHYVYNFEGGGWAFVHKNVHGRVGRVRASVASIDAAKALRLADTDTVCKLAEETRAIVLPRKNGPSASLTDYARTFAAITLWPKILDEAKLSSEDLDGLISRVNDCIFHHGLKYANGSIGMQVPTSQVEVTLCGTADAPWAWPGDRTAEEIAGLGLLRALKAYRQANGGRK